MRCAFIFLIAFLLVSQVVSGKTVARPQLSTVECHVGPEFACIVMMDLMKMIVHQNHKINVPVLHFSCN
uniref:Secreted protein n=1 Tax=Panagrolaimus sp. ES5 TaxID=591445 RepID=A0AC34F0L9_9BILA